MGNVWEIWEIKIECIIEVIQILISMVEIAACFQSHFHKNNTKGSDSYLPQFPVVSAAHKNRKNKGGCQCRQIPQGRRSLGALTKPIRCLN